MVMRALCRSGGGHNRGMRRLIVTSVLGAAALAAQAQDAGSLLIAHPWARATAQGQTVGGAYLEIDNRGKTPDRLLGVQSGVADAAQMHRMQMEGNVMRMREVPAIEIPAGGKVALTPGGLHIMLVGLKAPLATGRSFPLVLRFEKAGEVKVEVKVESAVPAGHEMKH
jgi:copper(I)-binding protein